ncbi:polysaccharide deacetylase family sporulation protein PdaB [Desulforamulus hydrothermalis]|uniref:Putative polysaccharide deacetylase pdaB n=1 Tax=Desulforamulus hydrothermalis Lam5 = DSM 18033 TaxID=1121428 RepID=K8DXD8_9FIRM|nr:polysaccharide deacetylase family sporulation protein PdaB [Desulforamulus hydrothermalis]CCO07277.1 putative polysaccharide deacetylase pdaB [Desulforamulus hydrothermalis Lam5 = DSM 18033]SHG92978.1 polysaccharide deacetylase family sporulation protein PdaB [Desulforamulus hydrothermalis Lam5 = DSM 18033]
MKAYIFDWRKCRKQLMLLGAIFICALFFGTLLYRQQAVTVTGKKYAIYKVKTDEKVAALTFDISWGTKVPGPVLDTLKRYDVKCTFFVSGPWVVKHPEFPQRIVSEGHEIASHGEEHVNLSQYNKEEIKKNILAAHEKIKQVTGVAPNLIRTPNGDWNNLVLTAAEELNYKVIQWSADSLDWKKPGVDVIVNNVLKKVKPGAIILMHASDTCLQTPAALPPVLEGLQKQGYRLVTVSELLTMGSPAID